MLFSDSSLCAHPSATAVIAITGNFDHRLGRSAVMNVALNRPTVTLDTHTVTVPTKKNASEAASQLRRMHEAQAGKTRGVEHLCRWETEPFARPPPARPPGARSANGGVKKQQSQPLSQSPGSPDSDSGSSPSYSQPCLWSPRLQSPSVVTVDQEVKEAAIALAQLSVAKEGEYLGTGSLVSALHRLDDSDTPQTPIDKISGLPFFTNSQYSSTISTTFFNSLLTLISGFPDRLHCDALIRGYFEHDNWCIGVPQNLVLTMYDQMWVTIEADTTSMSRINFHWITLLFAIFAISSFCVTEDESRKYFLQALTAKRLGEDLLSASFNSEQRSTGSEGAEFACLSAALLGKYMMDRGQMTEAWKIVGGALRNAQNAGLHRSPAASKWKMMSEDERTLRCLSWHLCAMTDRFLSFILGRPVIIRTRDCDVPSLTVASDVLAPDGSTNTVVIFQRCLCALIDTVSEAKDRYLSVHPDLIGGSANFDSKMSQWQASLPAYFRVCQPADTSLDHAYLKLLVQRTMLRGFYLACCMLFHRSLPCAQPLPSQSNNSSIQPKGRAWDYDKIATYAVSLLRTQRTLLTSMWWQRQICFSANFLMFEAAITLSIVLLRDSGNVNAEEWRRERAEAIDMFESVRGRDFGDIVPQAVQVLRMLQNTKSKTSPPSDSMYTETKTEAVLQSQDYVASSLPSTSIEMLGNFWPQQLEMPAMIPMNTSDPLQSFDGSASWMTDGMNAQVTAFDLLHSLEK
ncbi:hypothetical protein EW145_g4842 [Phellinidium pouzarii]|uniref:Xylanolytic transcriptional activator regulatory domain-containing protein n=1 Tax=Phellinidium pouzarii TaxID=167371 RepID=A0A4S4L3G6_9AGAM|nr:hypothetical protein EW145_g4842 [Phellinidium pouzarii]